MSNEGREHLATVIARALCANYSITMVEIGIHVFMALYGLSVFLETPESERKGRKRYIVVSLLITTLRSLSASLDIAVYFGPLFRSTSPGHWRETMQIEVSKTWNRSLSGAVGVGTVALIGDTLLVYRCYIIWVEHWWVTILPAITSLLALAFFLKSLYGDSNNNGKGSEGAAWNFLTVSTNIVVTVLISFRLLRARRTLAKVLPSANLRVYTGVIAILVESAAPLTFVGIIAAVLMQLPGSSPSMTPEFYVAFYVFQGLFISICGLSPHMIIFRVTTGRSFIRFPISKDAVLSNPIQFNHQTAESSFLQSTLNYDLRPSTDPSIERRMNTSVGGATRTQTSPSVVEQE